MALGAGPGVGLLGSLVASVREVAEWMIDNGWTVDGGIGLEGRRMWLDEE